MYNYNLHSYVGDFQKWKTTLIVYYTYFLNVNIDNKEEYLNIRMEIVKNYFESLMFNLNYYFNGVPSWQWYYKYRITPLFSDLVYALDNNIINLNNINFEKGQPYTPFQQLMFILPPQLSSLVPSSLRPIFTNDSLLCTQFYPIEFKLDVAIGIKAMYSEAILPEIHDELLLETIKKYEKKLSEYEKKRNIISEKPKMG